MSTTELKKQLIDKIQKTEDESILKAANLLLDLETDSVDIYMLNEDQKKAVEEAKDDIKNGRLLTDEQVNKDIDEWLKK